MARQRPDRFTPSDDEIERAIAVRRRDDYKPIFRAVSDALDEYLSRCYGLDASHTHAGELVLWLSERGVLVIDAADMERLEAEIGDNREQPGSQDAGRD